MMATRPRPGCSPGRRRLAIYGSAEWTFTLFVLPWLYLRFLSWGLDSPLSRPLRRAWIDRAILVTPLRVRGSRAPSRMVDGLRRIV